MKKQSLLILSLLLLFFVKSHAQGGWTQNLTFGGSARTFPATFTIGTDVYVGVGLQSAAPQTASRDFWKFDPATGTWSQVANFTGNTRWASYGFAVDGKGYIGGGRDSLAVSYTDHWEYDSSSNAWSQKTDFPGGGRRGCAAAAYGGKGYVGLGWNGATYYSDWYEYDPTNDSWTQKSSYGGGVVNYPCAFVLGDKIYAGTGYNGTTYSADFYKYDPLVDTWTQINSIPGSGRYGCAAFTIGQYGYIGTGGTQNATSFTDFYRYDTVSGNWTQMVDMPGAVRYCVGFSYGKHGYVALGDSNNAVTNKIWTFDTTSIYTEMGNAALCSAGNTTVDFTTTDTLDANNLFTLELSDSSGDFTFPTVLDTMTGSLGSSFNFEMPKGLPPGIHYQMRTTSSLPSIQGYPSSYISLSPSPVINIPGSTSQAICGSGSVTLSADTSNVGVNYETFMVEITYDASQGQSTLSGSDKVYIHSGTADTTLSGTSWSNTVGNYGVDDGIGKMDSLGNDLWKITLNVPLYYVLGYGYGAKYLAMNFRNGDATKTGKASNGDDIFINLYNGNIISSSSSAVSAKFISSYQWYQNGSAISGANTASLTTNQTGDYKLAVTGICSDTSQVYSISVSGTVTAGLNLSSNSMCLGGTGITFTDTSSNAGGTRTIYFGDGNSSTSQSVTHAYTQAGTYTVRLIIQSAGGCQDSTSTTVDVYNTPSAAISIANTVQCKTNNSFSMSDNSSLSSGSWTRSWNFGDGSSDTTSTTAHSYAADGNYDIKLYITSDKGCVDSAQQTITVRPSPNQNMYINAVGQCLQGNNFSFIDSTTISSGSITTHDWDFGDGQTSTGTISPTHTYAAAGAYTVQLINSSALGCTDTIKRVVNVYNKPTATITPSSTQTVCQGGSVVFKTVSSSGLTYQWYKNGSAISGANADSIVVSDSGDYHVIIDVPGGCGDTSSAVTMKVIPKPTISAITGSASVNQGATVAYSVTAIAGITFNWSVTGGTILSGQGSNAISVKWNAAGNGSVSVSANCSDTMSLAITIVNGISSEAGNVSFSVYPNPVQQMLTVDASAIKGNYLLKVIDISGKTIFSEQKSSALSQVDMSAMPQGIYILEINHIAGVSREMIVKQ